MSTTTKTVLITGASSGIGYDVARGFLQKGANVVLNARNADKLSAAAQRLTIFRGCHEITGEERLIKFCRSSNGQLWSGNPSGKGAAVKGRPHLARSLLD